MGTLALAMTISKLKETPKYREHLSYLFKELRETDNRTLKHIQAHKEDVKQDADMFIIDTMTSIPYIYRVVDDFRDIIIAYFKKPVLREFSRDILGEDPVKYLTAEKTLKLIIQL